MEKNSFYRGVQKIRQPARLGRFLGFGGLGWVGLGYKFFFNSALGWVWVIKLQPRQTQPNPTQSTHI